MRYTHKLDKPEGKRNYFLIPDQEQCDNAENKLGQLEDLEEDLGADLITIFKALKNGIYIRDHLGYIRKKDVRLDVDEGLLLFVSPDEFSGSGRLICGCGYDWALTKAALVGVLE